jgi:hypothetical protein
VHILINEIINNSICNHVNSCSVLLVRIEYNLAGDIFLALENELCSLTPSRITMNNFL